MGHFPWSNSTSEYCFYGGLLVWFFCFFFPFSSSKNPLPDSPSLSDFICTSGRIRKRQNLSCSAFVEMTEVYNNHESGLSEEPLINIITIFTLKTPTTFGWIYRSWTSGCPEHLVMICRPFSLLLFLSWDKTTLAHIEMHFNIDLWGLEEGLVCITLLY